MTSIDPELKKIAKEKGWNISEELERALINKYHNPDMDKIKELKCNFCGTIGKQETKEDCDEAAREARRNENEEHPLEYSEPTKLTWLWPDEKWICNRCLRQKCHGAQIA